MDRQIAAITLQFLQRTNLTGAEVDAFQRVVAAISNVARGAIVMAPVEDAGVIKEPAE
jgi:hypothetical protein